MWDTALIHSPPSELPHSQYFNCCARKTNENRMTRENALWNWNWKENSRSHQVREMFMTVYITKILLGGWTSWPLKISSNLKPSMKIWTRILWKLCVTMIGSFDKWHLIFFLVTGPRNWGFSKYVYGFHITETLETSNILPGFRKPKVP